MKLTFAVEMDVDMEHSLKDLSPCSFSRLFDYSEARGSPEGAKERAFPGVREFSLFVRMLLTLSIILRLCCRLEDPAYESIELAAAQRERCREEGNWLEVGNRIFGAMAGPPFKSGLWVLTSSWCRFLPCLISL